MNSEAGILTSLVHAHRVPVALWAIVLIVSAFAMRPPKAAADLIVYAPSTSPIALSLSDKATKVLFRAFVSGSDKPPKSLFLHEVDREGQLSRTPVVELKDDGRVPDEQARDYTYTGEVVIESTKEESRDYKLRAEHNDKTILSDTYTLYITPFPLEIIPPKEGAIIQEYESGFMLFSNEVVVGVRPGVTSDRIRKIALDAGATVISFSPLGRYYLFEIKGDGTVDRVYDAIKTILKNREVEYAEPSYVSQESQFPNTPPKEYGFPPNCTGSSQCQWYMGPNKLDALRAWRKAQGGGAGQKVAVIEPKGKIDFTHPDLQGQQAANANTSGRKHHHATMVGGLIAAKADNATGIGSEPGISGTAFNVKLLPYDNYRSTARLAQAIGLALSHGARIINISQQGNKKRALRNTIGYAINTIGALVVASAGNHKKRGSSCRPVNIWPARYNTNSNLQSGLLAIGATDTADRLAEWSKSNGEKWCSNNASWIDLYAPGVRIYSTAKHSNYRYLAGNGTSYAAALVSGAAAVIWAQHQSWSAQKLHNELISKADRPHGLKRLNMHQVLP